MMWYKDDISRIDSDTKEQWYDVYNYRLLEDRDFDISKMTDKEVQKAKAEIKKSYFDYLEHLPESDNFVFYYCLEEDDKIIAVARVIIKNQEYYIEGLETHRDFRKQGYGKRCVLELLNNCKRLNIDKLYSKIRKNNIASINTHKSCGFEKYKVKDNSVVLFKQL